MKPLILRSSSRQSSVLRLASCILLVVVFLAVACKKTIDGPPGLSKIHIAPKNQTVSIGATQQFGVTGEMSDGSSAATVPVTYSATGGTVTAAGLYTAGSVAGSYRVVAAQQDGSLADTATVTIPNATATVSSIVLSPSAVSVPAGMKQQFTAKGVLSTGDTAVVAVTYTATGGTINAQGLFTAGATTGAFRVIAVQKNGTLADTADVTITAAVVTGLTITPKSAGVAPNGTQQFSSSFTLSTGATQTPPANSVTYTATGGTITAQGLYTAGATAGTYRAIATYTPTGGSALADTATITVATMSNSVADPSQLPAAAHQSPDYGHYVGASLKAGQSYNDPVSGARVWKLTDATTPRSNSGIVHGYSSGIVQVSRAWGPTGTTHTALLMLLSGEHWFVDFTRGTGIANWRIAPNGINGDLSFTFSYNPATPRIGYYLEGAVLKRYDAAAMALAPQGLFPKDLSSAGGNLQYTWLQQDKNDEWFVMMPGDQSRIIAWNSRTDQMRVMTTTRAGVPFNEPRFERDGRYVLISLNIQGWISWDLVNDTFTTFTTAENHTGGARHFFASNDPNPSNGPQFRFDPTTNTSTTIPNLSGAQGLSVYLQHRGDQWVMSDQELGGDLTKQWMLSDTYNDGRQNASWTLDNGEVYVATISSFSYDEQRVGINSVRQYVAGSTGQYASQLAPVTSRAAMTEGTFYYDGGTHKLYVWAVGGGSPAGRVDPRVNGALHDAVGFFRLDGSELRILAHHYSLGTSYWTTPRATISADGKIVLFDSNMNNINGRGDVFLVEVPIK